MSPVEIRLLQAGDEGVLTKVAPDVFDNEIQSVSAQRFLRNSCHHLVVALDADVVIGFVSGVHHFHPDKSSPELFVNEVGVAPGYQGRGIGKRMLAALFEAGRQAGCTQAWLLTEQENAPAVGLYRAAGGKEELPTPMMFSFSISGASV